MNNFYTVRYEYRGETTSVTVVANNVNEVIDIVTAECFVSVDAITSIRKRDFSNYKGIL